MNKIIEFLNERVDVSSFIKSDGIRIFISGNPLQFVNFVHVVFLSAAMNDGE